MKKTPDRFDGTKAMRPPQSAPPPPVLEFDDESTVISGSRGGQVSLRLIWRALPPSLVASLPPLGARLGRADGAGLLQGQADVRRHRRHPCRAGRAGNVRPELEPDRLRRVQGDPGRTDHQPDRARHRADGTPRAVPPPHAATCRGRRGRDPPEARRPDPPQDEPDPGLDVVEVTDRIRRRSSMPSSMLT